MYTYSFNFSINPLSEAVWWKEEFGRNLLFTLPPRLLSSAWAAAEASTTFSSTTTGFLISREKSWFSSSSSLLASKELGSSIFFLTLKALLRKWVTIWRIRLVNTCSLSAAKVDDFDEEDPPSILLTTSEEEEASTLDLSDGE